MTTNTETERKAEPMIGMTTMAIRVQKELISKVREDNPTLKHATLSDIVRAGIGGLIGMSIEQALETYGGRPIGPTESTETSGAVRSDSSTLSE